MATTTTSRTGAREQPPTRERIVTEAVRLFAERGFRGTTVGDIEAAAGLSPRSGGLYKHFRSKEELLLAAIERHVSEIEAVRGALELLPLGDLRAELTFIARWALSELGAEQPLMRIVQRDGRDFPELVAEVHRRIVEGGEEEAAKVFERLLGQARVGDRDPRALGAVALGSLVAYRIQESMFGVPPYGLRTDDFVEAWVDVWATYAERVVPRALPPKRSAKRN